MGVTLLPIVSDLHIHSTIGLSLPRLELDDGGSYKASRTQWWLGKCWLDFWDEVARLKAEYSAHVFTVFDGDLGELDTKRRTHQLISRSKAEALRHIAALIERPVDLSDWALFLRGTNSHVGLGSWLEEEIARDCIIAARPDDTVYSWDSFYGEIGGLVFDIQHFGRLGNTEETRANPLHKLATRLERKYTRRRQRVPHLAIRAHRHFFADTHDDHPVRCLATGSFQGKPEYIYQKSDDDDSEIGGYIITVFGGKNWTVKRMKYEPIPPKIWALPPLSGNKT